MTWLFGTTGPTGTARLMTMMLPELGTVWLVVVKRRTLTRTPRQGELRSRQEVNL